MKKLVVLFFAMIILCAAASADFLVESFTIGYSNTTLNVKSLYTKAPAHVEKVNLPITMHQLCPYLRGSGICLRTKAFILCGNIYSVWGICGFHVNRKSCEA